MKGTFKEKSFQVMQVKASELGYRIIDIDLTSCYVSTMLGLYQEQMPYIDEAVANTGLCKFLENEFIEKPAHKDYNKPAIKVCIYASVFEGGGNAMPEKLLHKVRESLGLQPKPFKNLREWQEFNLEAATVSDLMENSKIVADFTNIAKHV